MDQEERQEKVAKGQRKFWAEEFLLKHLWKKLKDRSELTCTPKSLRLLFTSVGSLWTLGYGNLGFGVKLDLGFVMKAANPQQKARRIVPRLVLKACKGNIS